MRAAPAVAVTVTRSRTALAALSLLALASLAVTGLWAWQRRDWAGAAAFLLVGLHVLWLAGSVARRGPLQLRWDQRWWLAPAAGGAPQPGTLAVALDLGGWMLLRFRADAAGLHGRARWLPVERAALAGQWHALRCAVYSPEPAEPAAARPDAPA